MSDQKTFEIERQQMVQIADVSAPAQAWVPYLTVESDYAHNAIEVALQIESNETTGFRVKTLTGQKSPQDVAGRWRVIEHGKFGINDVTEYDVIPIAAVHVERVKTPGEDEVVEIAA